MNRKILILVGPTASGKSYLADLLMPILNGIVINADSVQLFCDIPIISAQSARDDSHKLYGILKSDESSSVGKYLILLREEVDKAYLKGKFPIIVGGTGMYVSAIINGLSKIPEIKNEVREEARNLLSSLGNEKFHELLKSLDPISTEKLNINDSQRMQRAYEVVKSTGQTISYWKNKGNKKFFSEDIFCINLVPERNELYKICDARFINMIKEGAIDEVKRLMKIDYGTHITQAIGVREIMAYIKEEITKEEMIAQAQKLTRNYAKRQYTWFKNQIKNSYNINYNKIEDLYSSENMTKIIQKIEKFNK